MQLRYQTTNATNKHEEIYVQAKQTAEHNDRIQRNELIVSASVRAEATKPSSTTLIRDGFTSKVILYGYIMVGVKSWHIDIFIKISKVLFLNQLIYLKSCSPVLFSSVHF